MLQENKRVAACMHVHPLLIRTLIGTYLVVCCFCSGDCATVPCCGRGSTTTYILVHTAAVLLLLYTGTAVPPATLVHKEAYIGMADRFSEKVFNI